MTRPPGTLIDGRYRTIRYLGTGSFGEVYEVLDEHQESRLALKFLNSTPTGATGIWREARVLTLLRSEYILPVWNADFDAGVPYLVTELAANGAAADKTPGWGVDPALAVRWLRSASRGVARTHDAGLLHRDIKPDNIFINDRNEALLGDFGLACLMGPTGDGPYGGTLVTMAPEVAAGGGTSVRSDVYSLGATLYQLLAGKYPFEHSDPAVLRGMVVGGKPTALRDAAPHVPQALARRVEQAMAPDPADRYRSAQDLDAALGQLPTPSRHWVRTDEHAPQHVACWRGAGNGKTSASVCLNAVGTRAEVVAAYQPSGRRIARACRLPAPESALPRNVRAAIRALG